MKMAKRIFSFIKEKYNYFNFALLTLLLFLSCCFEPCVYVTVAYCVLIAIVLPVESILQMILFTTSFVLVFKINNDFPIHTLMWVTMVFIIGIKYLIDVFKKNKSINWKTLIPIIVFLLFVILPVHEAKIVLITIYVGLLALLYLTFEYRKEVSFKKLVITFCLGIIVSCLLHLTKFISPRINALLPVIYAENCSYVRFLALTGHPNNLAVSSLIAVSFLFVLLYKKQITLRLFLPVFVGIFIPAYLAISRNFVMAFSILFLIFMILSFIKYRKTAFLTTGCLALVMLIVIVCCYYPTEAYFARFNNQNDQEEEQSEVSIEPPTNTVLDENIQEWWNGVYAGEIHYDPGRKGIWQMYLYDWTSSAKNILCGRGVSAKAIGQMAAHNTLIQLLWEHGVIGIILLLWVVLSFVDFKKLKYSLSLLILVVTPIIMSAMLESFNVITELMPTIVLITAMEFVYQSKNYKSDVKALPNKKTFEKNDFNSLVSVIIPVYNVEVYLDRCLASIVKQTYENLEIILVDDGSTDTCPKKCDEWAKKDHRIKVIHKKNGGLSDARNAGIDQATGDFLCFIDSDDFVHQEFVQVLLNNLLETDSDLSICYFRSVDENTQLPVEVTAKHMVIEGNEIPNVLFEKYNLPFVSACTKLYKKEIFNDLRFDVGRINEDNFVIHKILMKCKKIVFTKGEYYYYYKRANSITRAEYFTEKNLDYFVAHCNWYEYFKGTQFEGKALNKLVDSICRLYQVAFSRNADTKTLTFLRENFIKYYKLNPHKSFPQMVFLINPRLFCWIVKFVKKIRR